jgi:hypothetical protein
MERLFVAARHLRLHGREDKWGEAGSNPNQPLSGQKLIRFSGRGHGRDLYHGPCRGRDPCHGRDGLCPTHDAAHYHDVYHGHHLGHDPDHGLCSNRYCGQRNQPSSRGRKTLHVRKACPQECRNADTRPAFDLPCYELGFDCW